MLKNKNRKNRKNGKSSNNGYALISQRVYTNRENTYITGIDPHKYVCLKYVDNFSASVATTAGTQQTMNLNSIFDPDRSGGGHQPLYYDQYAALYNRYRVLKVWWKVSFANNTGSYNTVVVPTNGLLSSSVAGSATYVTAAEQPRAVYKLVPGTGGFPVVYTGSISLNNLNGCTETEYLGDDRFEAQIGASPTEIMVLNLGVYNPTLATIIVNWTIEMKFYVDLHDVISIAGS